MIKHNLYFQSMYELVILIIYILKQEKIFILN